MHAGIHDLLNLRDGEPVDLHVREHVGRCPRCTAELDRLVAMRRRLAAAPRCQPPDGGWTRVEAALSGRRVARSSHVRGASRLAAAAAGVAVLVLTADRIREPPDPAMADDRLTGRHDVLNAAAMTAAPVTDIARLIAESQHLESRLGDLPQRPHAEQAGTSLLLDQLEQRIAVLDATLTFAPEAGLTPEQSARLWAERVTLLDSLVNVRYAQAQSLAF